MSFKGDRSAIEIKMSSAAVDTKTIKVDLEKQSIEFEPGVRTSIFNPDGKSFPEYMFEDAKTCYECFLRGLKISKNEPCLGRRSGPKKEYEWMTYQEVYDKVHQFGSGLIHDGFQPGQETFMGIFARNCPEWVIAEKASNMFNTICVPLYDTLGEGAIKYTVNQTEMHLIVCDTKDKAEKIVKYIDQLASVKMLVVMEMKPGEIILGNENNKIKIKSFEEILENGRNNLQEPQPGTADDIVQLCYTSGTTGNPKGVIQTNKMMVSNSAAILMQFQFEFEPKDSIISYLPLAHVYERVLETIFLTCGARIGFFNGDVRTLIEDVAALQPAFFPTVPRVLSKLKDQVYAGIANNPEMKAKVEEAIQKKVQCIKQGKEEDFELPLPLARIRQMLGKNLKVVSTGAASLPEHTIHFAMATFGCHIFEGYGQTEASAVCTCTSRGAYRGGHVGAPLPTNIVRLKDVPEMDIVALRDKKGEVCVKGICVTPGYFKNPEITAETIDSEGWLHTGDIGEWTEFGTLKIVDRRKHIFKLAQGEYVAPERLEVTLIKSKFVSQVFVEGNSLETYAIAIVVPMEEEVQHWAESNQIKGTFEELCQDKELHKAIVEDLTAHGKADKFKGFELVKKVHLCPEGFTPENGLLTPTFKMKRAEIRKVFKSTFENMYKSSD